MPFFSCAASEFVELFVGVGASRVRDLFEKVTFLTTCPDFSANANGICQSVRLARSCNVEAQYIRFSVLGSFTLKVSKDLLHRTKSNELSLSVSNAG